MQANAQGGFLDGDPVKNVEVVVEVFGGHEAAARLTQGEQTVIKIGDYATLTAKAPVCKNCRRRKFALSYKERCLTERGAIDAAIRWLKPKAEMAVRQSSGTCNYGKVTAAGKVVGQLGVSFRSVKAP